MHIKVSTEEEIKTFKAERQPTPTLEERNRADIDYIAIMTGVELYE